MTSRFVRNSKYRHVFGRSTRKEQCYDNLHVSRNAWDSNIIKANPLYLSVNWESSGGGAFAVIPLSHRGRLPEQIPLFRGHTATVLDTDWSPFNDSLVASGSDDWKVFIWQVPDNFTLQSDEETGPTDVSPVHKLAGHARKVGHVLFHPSAENVLATSSADFTVKLWDVETGQARCTETHTDIVQSMSFSGNGSLMVTTCRDKKLRVWDLRQEKVAQEVAGHAGAKNSRAVWMGDLDRIATTGFSKMSDRQLGLWDSRNPGEPLGGFQMLDSISGVCMPFWDDGTKCLYLAGKGDGNIRYYEYSNDDFVFLSEYKSADPQRGVAFLPRRGLALHENEVMRAFKTVNDSYIEPVSFIVPRRAEVFQSDIYPEAPSGQPGLTAAEWFDGKDASVPMMDLSHLWSDDGVPPPPAASVPSSSGRPSISSKTFTPSAPTVTSSASDPEPASVRSRTQSVVEQKAVKPEPTPPPPTTTTAAKPSSPVERRDTVSSIKDTAVAAKDAVAASADTGILAQGSTFVNALWQPAKAAVVEKVQPAVSRSVSKPTSPTETSSFADASIATQLGQITKLLEQQTKSLALQDEKMTQLAAEVDTLKSRLDDGKGKDEIIRKLELQLEEAKS